MIAREQVKSVVQPLPEKRQQNFDYTALDSDIEKVVKQCADQIKSLMHQTIKTNIEIGHNLIKVKQELKHGQFVKWIKSEFSWGLTTAYKFIHVAENCEEVRKFSQYENLIDTSTLYLIAAPSTPQKARQELLNLVKEGEKVTNGKACKVIAKYQDTANQEAEQISIFNSSSETKTQQNQEIQSPDEMPVTNVIDPAKPLEDNSAGEEEQQRKEAQPAEPGMPSSSDVPASPKQDSGDRVEKEQSKEGSSNSSVQSQEPDANQTDNHFRQDEANNDINQTQKQVSDEKDRGIGDRLSEESPLFNETSNQQNKAKGKANQSPHSGENGACTHVAENPETSVEQQQQHTQPPPRVKPNDSTKVDLGDRTDSQIHDHSDNSILNNNLQHINAKQRVKQIVVALDITKEQLNVSTLPKAEIAECLADVKKCSAKLEQIAKELKQKLENEH